MLGAQLRIDREVNHGDGTSLPNLTRRFGPGLLWVRLAGRLIGLDLKIQNDGQVLAIKRLAVNTSQSKRRVESKGLD